LLFVVVVNVLKSLDLSHQFSLLFFCLLKQTTKQPNQQQVDFLLKSDLRAKIYDFAHKDAACDGDPEKLIGGVSFLSSLDVCCFLVVYV